MALDKNKLHEYSRLRELAEQRTRRLEKAGLEGGKHFPKVSELKTAADLRRAEKAVSRFMESKTTVAQARAEQTTIEYQQRQRRRQMRRESRKRRKEFLAGLTEEDRQRIKNLTKHGVRVTEKNFDAWNEYLEYRKAMQDDTLKYEFDKWVEEFKEIMKNPPDESWEDIRRDFDEYRVDRENVKKRAQELADSGEYSSDVFSSMLKTFVKDRKKKRG